MQLYKSYVFKDKDPVIDKIRTIIADEGDPTLGKVSEGSGVSASTIYNWLHGDTMRPQYATIAAVVTSLGYEIGFHKNGKAGPIRKRKVK